MTDGVTALIFGAGFGVWIYAMMMRSTSNPKNSLVAAVVAAFGGFIVIFTLMKFVFHF
jgi:hypothetical protein